MAESFASHLRQALASLERECRPHHARMIAALCGRAVRFVVDQEALTLSFSGQAAVLSDHDAVVECVTTRAAIIALAHGELTLEEAILADRIDLRGSLDDLLALHDALIAYIHGAVRAPSSTTRFARYAAGEAPPDAQLGRVS